MLFSLYPKESTPVPFVVLCISSPLNTQTEITQLKRPNFFLLIWNRWYRSSIGFEKVKRVQLVELSVSWGMAEETHVAEPAKVPMKRNIGKKKGSKAKKKPTNAMMLQGIEHGKKDKKIDRKMKKLFRKRAREYNSDEDDGDGDGGHDHVDKKPMPVIRDEERPEEEGEDVNVDNGVSDDEEDGEIQLGITKFVEGCRAFKMAFSSIIKKSVTTDSLVR
jgi:hypothetical protein